jgi:diguanylate cyclase (GGDEF)-like protein
MNGSSPQRSSPQGGGRHARGDAPPSGWQAAIERAREDPQLGLISFFAALIALIVLPFSIYRFAQGQIGVGIIDAVIVIAVSAVGIVAWLPGQTERAGILMAIVTTTGCLVVSVLFARHGLLWSYAVLTTNFLMTSRRLAMIANVIVLAILGSHPEVFANHIERVVFLSSGLLVTLCAFIFSLQSTRQRQALEHMAIHDPLTQALNRRAFDIDLATTLQAHQLSQSPCTLAIIDLDHFKSVNDTFGHEVGDELLVEMVRTLRSHQRKQDRLYRFGGEEFILLMPDTHALGVQRALDGLREKIFQTLRRPDGQPVSVSIGAATLAPGERGAFWLTRADAALYRAKNGGRNRVMMADQFDQPAQPAADRRGALHD